jgi:hypothetical protein
MQVPTGKKYCLSRTLIHEEIFINRGDIVVAISKAKEISTLVDLLPDNEQVLAYELIKRMVLAWDSDFTKLTPAERKRLDEAEHDFNMGNTVSHSDIDWN